MVQTAFQIQFCITNGNATFSGNVGIGTTTSAAKLDVIGQVRAFTQFHLGENYNSGSRGITVDNGESTAWEMLTLRNVSGTHFRILGNGSVGIGTSSPSQKLHVTGNIILDPGTSPALYTGTGSSELNRFLALLNSPNLSSASGLKAGGILVSDSYSYANPGKNDLIVKGNVGIGTPTPDAKLAVKGTIHAQEVKVDLNGAVAPDYVFSPNYKLLSLEEIKSYIDQHKHLPEVPSAKEMESNGVNVSEMNMILLKKIEELTLYQIEATRQIQSLKTKVQELESKLN